MDNPTNILPWRQVHPVYDDPERKKLYAALARVRPDTDAGRFEAACLTFPEPENQGLAHQARFEYRFDRIVIEETTRLAEQEPEAGLPTKAQQARDLYNIAADATKSVDDRLKAHKLYADMMGYVSKPGTGAGNTFIDNRRIYMPAPPASDEEWEKRARANQLKLIADAANT